MKTLKKEISEKIRVTRRNGFGNGFDYNGEIKGFSFETRTDTSPGELYECDDTGHMTHVANIKNKAEAVNAIYEWFKDYAQ